MRTYENEDLGTRDKNMLWKTESIWATVTDLAIWGNQMRSLWRKAKKRRFILQNNLKIVYL